MVLLLGAAGLLQWIAPESVDKFYFLALLFALLLGVVHVLLLYRFFPSVKPEHFWTGFLISCGMMAVAGLLVCVAFYFMQLNLSFATYIFSFLIPYGCWQAFRYFLLIPEPTYGLWYYPVNEPMPDLDMIDLSQIEVVQFVFAKKAGDTSQTTFTSKAPLNMNLGQLFFIFINDYNEKNQLNSISYLDDQKQPFGWLFYRKKKWFGTRQFFDPNLTFRNNGIRANELIYAARMEG